VSERLIGGKRWRPAPVPEALRAAGERPVPEAHPGFTRMALLMAAVAAIPAAVIVLAAGLQPGTRDLLVGAVLLTLLVVVIVGRLLVRSARRRKLVARGVVVSGRVVSAWAAGARLVLKFEYAYDGRLFEGETLEDVIAAAERGLVPQPNDTAFLIVDPTRPTRRVVWGYGRAG